MTYWYERPYASEASFETGIMCEKVNLEFQYDLSSSLFFSFLQLPDHWESSVFWDCPFACRQDGPWGSSKRRWRRRGRPASWRQISSRNSPEKEKANHLTHAASFARIILWTHSIKIMTKYELSGASSSVSNYYYIYFKDGFQSMTFTESVIFHFHKSARFSFFSICVLSILNFLSSH